MEFDFVWSTPSAKSPQVSVANYGINFNSFVVEIMGRPKRIIIGFDEKQNVIGVKPANDTDENRGFEFAEKERKGYVRINNKDFIKYISQKTGIDFTKSQQIIPEWIKDEQLLIIDISKLKSNN